MANSFHRSARRPHIGLKEVSLRTAANGWASTLSADRMRPPRSNEDITYFLRMYANKWVHDADGTVKAIVLKILGKDLSQAVVLRI